MKSKTSYFDPNGLTAILRDNFRRFWPLPVVGSLVYFISGVLPILTNYGQLEPIATEISLTLYNYNYLLLAAHGLLAILAATMVFRYLHKSGSVSVLHAMPFTKASLFSSNLLSGLALCTSPMLLNGLLLLVMAKPVYMLPNSVYALPEEYSAVFEQYKINAFGRTSILAWMLESFIIILFIFSIAVLAGMVTGNIAAHLATAFGFNAAAPALVFAAVFYCDYFLEGFNSSNELEQIYSNLSPLLKAFDGSGINSAIKARSFDPSYLIYMILAAAFLLLAYHLYKKRRLERAGDSIVFSFLEPICCVLLSFFTMTLSGVYFSAMYGGEIYVYGGCIGGMLAGLLAAQIIFAKSVRVFNWRTFRRLGLCTLMAALVLSAFRYDVFRYTENIPKLSDIDTVFVDQDYYHPKATSYMPLSAHSQEDIRQVQLFHSAIIKILNENERKYGSAPTSENRVRIYFSYSFKDSEKQFSRNYEISISLLQQCSDELKSFYESDFFQGWNRSLETDVKDIVNAAVLPGNYEMDSPILDSTVNNITDPRLIAELKEALKVDTDSTTMGDISALQPPVCTASFTYYDQQYENKFNTSTMLFDVYPYYKNTLGWLAANGFENCAVPADQQVSALIIAKGMDDSLRYSESISAHYNLSSGLPDDPDLMVVTDRESIESIFASCQTVPMDTSDIYTVTLVYPTTRQGEQPGAVTYFLNPPDIPDQVLEYFK